MLVQANLFIANVILYAMGLPTPPDYPPLVNFTNLMPVIMPEGKVRVLSAPLLGNWDTNLSTVGGRLDTSKVCEFLSKPKFAVRVAKVTGAKEGGSTSRFHNLSLYIRKECLKVRPLNI